MTTGETRIEEEDGGEIKNDCDDYDDDEKNPTLFRLKGVDTSLDGFVLEDSLAKIILCDDNEDGAMVTLLEKDFDNERGTILFCVHNNNKTANNDAVLESVRDYLANPTDLSSTDWIPDLQQVSIEVLEEDNDDDCVEYISEEEAYQLWLEQQQQQLESVQDHLVSSPDGDLIVPTHDDPFKRGATVATTTTALTTLQNNGLHPETANHLKRDPELFDFDNVPRVHYTELFRYLSGDGTASNDNQPSLSAIAKDFGSRPVVFYGLDDDDADECLLHRFQTNLRSAIRTHGTDTIVRTGNRETLVRNGFHNSRAADLGTVAASMLDTEQQDQQEQDHTIVFNPIHELPQEFRHTNVLGEWVDFDQNNISNNSNKNVFPNTLWNAILNPNNDDDAPKYTLCMANEGFGIGMHKHGPALFFLTEGRKKWYLSHPTTIDALLDNNNKTHPGFYRDLSSHKCIQEPGELLLVPNSWYHEIYNLSSPTIGIQALANELEIPGTLQ